MKIDIDKSWAPFLQEEFDKPYFKNVLSFIETEYKTHTCFPPAKDIFNAFTYCDFNAVKVVIIGQDPYHNFNQANGLSFSVNANLRHPASLKNIFIEVEQDIGTDYPKSGDLKRWALQGVLLLNSILTVRAHQAGSHQNKGWEIFTDKVISLISEKKKDVVFLLWGNYAKKKGKLIDNKRHSILESGHPSPLSANRGYWFGNKHFSKTNFLLEQVGKYPIRW